MPSAAPGADPTEYTKLGRTDLTVSRIALGGAWAYGNAWTEFDEAGAAAAVRRARELGVTFFDTARAYGFGKSERVMGDALREDLRERRDDIVLATKGGLGWDDAKGLVRDASADALAADLDASLDLLGVDHVDVYMVHWPDPGTPVEETARAMRQFVKDGKVKHVGASNFTANDMETFERHCPVDVLQPPYHLFERAIEEDVLPYCRAHDTGVFIWGPLAHGLLAGKYAPDQAFPDGNWRSASPMFTGDTFRRNLAVVDELKAIAAAHDRTVAELAIAWTLQQPGVHAAIVGARHPRHVEGTASAADFTIPDADVARIEEIARNAEWVSPRPESV